MQDIQRRNDEMVSLLTADLLSSDDRNVAFAAVDLLGNSFSLAETHVLSTVALNTAPTVFQWSGSILTLPEAGIYQLMFNAVILNSTQMTWAEAMMWVQEDAAIGSFSTMPGMMGYTYLTSSGQGGISINGVFRSGFNYRYRIQVGRNAGTDTLAVEAGSSRLSVVRLYRNR